jgi:hypothetical protein
MERSNSPQRFEEVDGPPVAQRRQMGDRAFTVSTRYGRQSTEGYAQGSRLSVDRCTSYELDGDARQTQGFYPGLAVVRA